MSITVLPQHVADQIAAGEVVERPASVIKELIENSLDAGATQIDVHIENGGKTLIEVRDNGKGMEPEDAQKCILRHATSKIGTIDDLFSIRSFGFRGEALAAISAVSRCSIITKTNNAHTGTKVSLEGGQNLQAEDTAANTGTIITIRDLFYTTPARLEYLKADPTEYRHIVNEILYFALSNPQVGFSLTKNETRTQDLPATDTLKNRIHQILPKMAGLFVEVNGHSSDTRVNGYVGQAGTGHPNKNHQYIFVNGRHINDYRLTHAVREAYNQSCGLEHHLHPMFVIEINTDPLLVDVNVHPRKLEIKFSDPADIYQLVKRSVIDALQKSGTHTDRDQDNTGTHFPHRPPSNTFSFGSSTPSKKMIHTGNSFSQSLFQGQKKSFQDLSVQRDSYLTVPQEETEKNPLTTLTRLTALAQIKNKYILAEADNGLFLFDQHALHERERFEKLWNDYKSKDIQVQALLTPQTVDLSEEDIELLNAHKTDLQSLGFALEFPSDSAVKIQELPLLLKDEDIEKIVIELIKYFKSHTISETVLDQLMRKLLEYKSCRGAIMYGDKISMPEAQKLLDDFLSTKWSTLCPHGRPNHVYWSFTDLDRKFHR